MPDPALPNSGGPAWEAEQATPWITVMQSLRALDGFCVHITVLSRETSPPGSCADGARYLIDSPSTGDWDDEEGGIAIALGEDASNGWHIVPAASIEQDGNEVYIIEEGVTLQRQSIGWVEGVHVLVDMTGAPDGGVIRWDASNGIFYVASS